MVKVIVPGSDESHLAEAVERMRACETVAVLTGAGISVESGIPDFRSPGGLWTLFSPDEYATLDVFQRDPAKAWGLYRALGKSIDKVEPNAAHEALARLERAGCVDMVVTQNVDGLHQAAGSRNVIEMHGDHRRVQCIRCGWLGPFLDSHLTGDEVPLCTDCGEPVKPNVVLFGEAVRGMEVITPFIERCDLLFVVGTSARVYPAAGLPALVKSRGGMIYEFNLVETELTRRNVFDRNLFFDGASLGQDGQTDFFFQGRASVSLPLIADRYMEAVS